MHPGAHRYGRGTLTRGLCLATVLIALASSVDARRIAEAHDLHRVVDRLEAARQCHVVRALRGSDRRCSTVPLDGAALELADDLEGLIWGEAAHLAEGRVSLGAARRDAWRALRCQIAISRHAEHAVRRLTERTARRDRQSRTRSRDGAPRRSGLQRACRIDVVELGTGRTGPQVGPQCAAAVGAPGSDVDAARLERCLDTLVRTWVGRHFPEVIAERDRRPPNLIVILVDDQRADAVGFAHPPDPDGDRPAMPATVDRLMAEGVVFRNAFATSPICGPSRAALLTGRYAHGNRVFRNEGLRGGAFFDDRDTLAGWLQAAGYRTGFFGKYMNQYSLRWASPLRSPRAPPGWDDWRSFDHPGSVPHFGFSMVENGEVVRYDEADYSTDVLAVQALDFVDAVEGDDRPFLLWFSAATPHHPWTPAPRHQGAFDSGPYYAPPSLFEHDVSDKPDWVGRLQGDTYLRRLGADLLRRRQLEMQLSVDEFVADLMARLDALGIGDETVVIYTSDNGQAWGEHRWTSKGCPWEECIRVPLIVRYPALAPLPRVDESLFSLVDLPATLADLAGAPMPADLDGRSRAATLDYTAEREPEGVLVEAYEPPVLEWVALRESRYKLVVYAHGPIELYDLRADPLELESLAAEPDQQARIAEMRAQLDASWPGWRP